MSASLPPTLPAIAVVLGLPLCRHHSSPSRYNYNNTTTVHHNNNDEECIIKNHNNNDAPSSHQDDNTNDNDTTQQLLFNQRVKNNVARIYARRVINRARLERDHPYSHHHHRNNTRENGDSSSSSSSKQNQRSFTLPRSQDNNYGSNVLMMSAKNSNSNSSSIDTWKDELLSETLVSLIKLQDRISKVKSFTFEASTGVAEDNIGDKKCGTAKIDTDGIMNSLFNNSKGGRNMPLLDQLLGISSSASTTIMNSNNLSFGFNNIINNSLVAQCEAKVVTPSKVKEWSDDIDLVQRRLEFGKEISPLSNTTRLQRWGMACKRILTLSMLAAPLGVLVPTNLVLGKIAGNKNKKKKKLVLPDDYDGSVVAVVKGGGASSSSNSTSTKQTEQQQQKEELSIMQKYHTSLTKATWNYALWAIESAGPTYIKLVQWASTRNDLFSPEFIGHFSKLQDETRGHTWKETEDTLYRAYGPDWKNVLSFDKIIDDGDDDYDSDDTVEGLRLKRKGGHENRERQKRLLALNEAPPTTTNNNNDDKKGSTTTTKKSPTIPIGSGCVAQVYKARLTKHHGLHPPGTSVAVKVQHPHILEKVCLDFYILNKLASALEYIPYLNLDYLSMKDSVDQFRDIMLPQLDLRVEAHNLQRFRRDFEGDAKISFPEPFMGLTSREVLVERFVEGEPMLNYVLKEDELHTKKDREELATIGLETVMKMIFLHDFVHADLVRFR